MIQLQREIQSVKRAIDSIMKILMVLLLVWGAE